MINESENFLLYADLLTQPSNDPIFGCSNVVSLHSHFRDRNQCQSSLLPDHIRIKDIWAV